MSRQALILRRRQTQQSGSSPAITVSAPHTEHFATFLRWSAVIDRFACSRISAGITGSALGCTFRLILVPSLVSLWQKPSPRTRRVQAKYVPAYAASGICTTTATSSEAPQRAHRWPGATRANLPFKSISAGTVWVQIGQWTSPIMWFSTGAFIALPSLHPTHSPLQGLYQNRKET